MTTEALRLSAIADALPVGIYTCDVAGNILQANQQCAVLWGRPLEASSDVKFCGSYRVYDGCGRQLVASATPAGDVLATGKPATARELTFERPDGSRVEVQADANPVFAEDGTLIGAICCLQDITARKEAEARLASEITSRKDNDERLEENEHRYRQMLDALPTAIYTTDTDGKITFFNQAAVTLAGRRPQLGSDEWCVSWRLYEPDGTPLPRDKCPMAVALKEQRAVVGTEAIAERPDGSRVRFLPYPTPVFDQKGRMTGAVNMLVDITDRHRDELQSARLAAIVASSDDAIVGKTLEGVVTSWNAGATRIFGYTADEMIGQHIMRIIPPELVFEEQEILGKLCRGEHIDHFETVRVGKDGRRIDVSVTVSPIRDRSGKLIGASKVGRDITERKHAEKVQRLLVSELNHRVKNTLATVQSIANQTVHSAKSAGEFAASFSGRIQALARTHCLLTDTTWQGAELAAIIRDQLSVSDGDDDRISYAGPAVTLNPQATLHLSLVLHELATNAQKYGALSDPRGKLSIRWIVRSAEGRQLTLQWQERGGPPVRVPTTRGFGSNLIERSLDAHGGKTTMHYEAEGVTCDITLPLSEIEQGPVDRYAKLTPTADEHLQSVPRPAECASSKGKYILVVDDEPLIAMDIVAMLEDEGCNVVGPAASVEKALALIDAAAIDAALLDANLAGEPVDALAAALTRRNIPFAFVSGYGREGLPQAFRQALLIKKPFQRETLIEVVQRLTSEAGVVQLRRQL